MTTTEANQHIFIIENRSIIELSGLDCAKFLQKLTTNNIEDATPQQCVYSCILSPKSKFLMDFFVFKFKSEESTEESLFIDIADKFAEEFISTIKKYRLKAKVEAAKRGDLSVIFQPTLQPTPSTTQPTSQQTLSGLNIVAQSKDPRLMQKEETQKQSCIGVRAIAVLANQPSQPQSGSSEGQQDYQDYEISQCIVDGIFLEQDKSFILEYGFEALNAVSFSKGCYMGQELITRTKHTGEIRKKVFLMAASSKHDDEDSEYDDAQQSLATVRDDDSGTIEHNGVRIGKIVAVNSSQSQVLVQIKLQLNQTDYENAKHPMLFKNKVFKVLPSSQH